jgi:EAL domain-containing protein (putative c-di-GMP-specific phosphodiesterase class I)
MKTLAFLSHQEIIPWSIAISDVGDGMQEISQLHPARTDILDGCRRLVNAPG